ncbi:MAG: response regulator transcription factor [Arcobacter sp.]|jgi:DNA-binding NarL/FixJ family response regulator|uniref:DNA-binding response regulator, NarL/FixJ family n=1 Tax=Arcobacter defluvii TaxID=873191 RepID=A0AAE7BGY7_9BACT|nr:response regulator transcription factor [Arcobacter defluvii]QKF77787.1 DNA-binding response regulator, NarL/FixJ family [Arcobacter defluvii]
MKIALYSNDIALISRWENILNKYETNIIEDYEDLSNLKNSILILSDCVNLENSDFIISLLLKNLNKILVLKRVPEFENARKWLEKGVQGYGNCLMTSSYLNSAVEAISNNYIWLMPQITTQLLKSMVENKDNKNDDEKLFEILTKTEKKIAKLLKNGYTNLNISQELDISINTVKTHIKHIYEKLNVKDRLSFAGLFSK